MILAACASERADVHMQDGTNVTVTCATLGQAHCTIEITHTPVVPQDATVPLPETSKLTMEAGSEHASPTALGAIAGIAQTLLPVFTAWAAK